LELKKSKRKDYYKILGVAKEATDEEMKKAYKKMALKWHPDKNNSSEEQKALADKMFKDVGEAYSILTDPEKRRMYDQGADLDEIN
jgi:DnaJ family protein C protein 7